MRIAVALVALVGCSDEPSGGGGPPIDSHVETYELPAFWPSEIDILFVIDDTTAMTPYQNALAAMPAQFANVLTASIGTFPDMRVAVTTTNAAAATFRQPSGTVEPYLAVSYGSDFTQAMNFQGTFASAFGILVDVGDARTGSSQPLEAAKLALAANPTFLRDTAYLAVATITVGDDASPGTPVSYADALKATKTDPARVVVSGLYDAPATRLDAFHNAFPNRSSVTEIDTTDLSSGLTLFTQLFRVVLGVPCFQEPADLDPDTAGPQYDCALAAIYDDMTEEALPQCAPTGGPSRCFEFVTDAQSCMEPGSKRLDVKGYPGPFHPAVRGQCVVE